MSKTKVQNFELSYNNWAGRGRVPDPVNTHFNALGPIAKVEREQSEQEKERSKKRLIPKETWDRIEGIHKRAKDYHEAFSLLPDIIGERESKGKILLMVSATTCANTWTICAMPLRN